MLAAIALWATKLVPGRINLRIGVVGPNVKVVGPNVKPPCGFGIALDGTWRGRFMFT